MRKASRTDANQAEIVKALRSIGATVTPLHAVGGGCPDLLVGYRNKSYCLEVKDPNQGSKQYREKNDAAALTKDQHIWFLEWQGHAKIVWTIEEAIEEVTR